MIKHIIILVSLIAFSCAENEINKKETLNDFKDTSISGNWEVVTYEDLLTGLVTTKTI